MITLITGTPGTGKTALTVSLILEALAKKRAVYQHGIRDLTLAVEPVYCGKGDCEFCVGKQGNLIDDFITWAPPGSLVVLDEVQRQYRARAAGAKVPKGVEGMETHRHGGIDFIVITQSPALIDQNIRKLVTMHHHLKPAPIGSFKYTWLECRNDPSSTAGAQKTTFKPPKESFQHYKSAELHTKVKKPIPLPLVIVGVGLVAAAYFAWAAYSSMRHQVGLDQVEEVAAETVAPAAIVSSAANVITGSGPVSAVQPDTQRFNFTPELPGVLESAPAYAGMVSYRDYPRRSACIKTATRCRCYTQQGTDYPTQSTQCEAFIEGRVSSFNPYASPRPMVMSRASAVPDLEPTP